MNEENGWIFVKSLFIIQAFICIALFINYVINYNLLRISISLITILVLYIPFILVNRYKVKIPNHMIILYFILTFCSLIFGSLFELFLKYWWLDGSLHFYSGIFITYVCYYYLTNINLETRSIALSVSFILLFAVFFNSFLSIIWEIYEFLMDIFLNLNMQENGIIDTMYDFIISLIGSILISIYLYKK